MVAVVDARPVATVLTWIAAVAHRMARAVGLRLPAALLPAPARALRCCRLLFDVSGISFHDGRLAVVGYNLLCVWPALLLRVPVVRLSQAMGPFQRRLNRQPARWVTRRCRHTFARGELTAGFLAGLGVPGESWSVAADVAFAYRPEYRLTAENEQRIAVLQERLTTMSAAGTDVVAVVPSSVVHQKLARAGGDYPALLSKLITDLRRRGAHVLVLPNATRAGIDTPRNNDLWAMERLRERLAAGPDGIDPDGVTFVDCDVDTASIRSLIALCTLVVTSRFHAMVAALALGVPPLVLGWSHKYEEVLKMFGCQDAAVDISEAEQRLSDLVERTLAERNAVRERILRALPEVTTSAVAQFDVLDRLGPRNVR
jgi:colanic acid/amylovoran biosynthesis protein